MQAPLLLTPPSLGAPPLCVCAVCPWQALDDVLRMQAEEKEQRQHLACPEPSPGAAAAAAAGAAEGAAAGPAAEPQRVSACPFHCPGSGHWL